MAMWEETLPACGLAQRCQRRLRCNGWRLRSGSRKRRSQSRKRLLGACDTFRRNPRFPSVAMQPLPWERCLRSRMGTMFSSSDSMPRKSPWKAVEKGQPLWRHFSLLQPAAPRRIPKCFRMPCRSSVSLPTISTPRFLQPWLMAVRIISYSLLVRGKPFEP